MKSVLSGIFAMCLISVGAWVVLQQFDTSASDAFQSPNGSVRLD